MAAILSQVSSSMGKKPSTTSSASSVVHPNSVALSSSFETNGFRRPQNNHEADVKNGDNGDNVDEWDGNVEFVNVVSTFKTHCHVDLRTLARMGANVELRRDPVSVLMKVRNPKVTASIWSSGKVVCIGARSEEKAFVGARRVARKIQQCGFTVRFVDFKVINCLGVVRLPFGVRIDKLKDAYPREFSYEPELHPAASWKLPEVGGQLQIFQTGNATITAPNEASARKTIHTVYQKLYEFRKPKDPQVEKNSRKSSSDRHDTRRLNDDFKRIKLEGIDGFDDEQGSDDEGMNG